MHIGFDISQTGAHKAGCGYYAHAMIQALLELASQHSYALYASFGDFYFDAMMPLNNPYKSGHYGPRHIMRETASQFWTHNNLEHQLKCPDIIHANNFWCPTQLTSSLLVYTLYDMSFLLNPNWTTEANRLGCFTGVLRSSVAADWIVAISKASKNHYLEIFPHFPPERIQVIYPCSRFFTARVKGKRPKNLKGIQEGEFWLSVGTIEPRKNHRMLVESYLRYIALQGKPMPLILAGGTGWCMDDFTSYLREVDPSGRIILTGYVSDEELAWLYQNCYANLYPSLFEGFGLPVLEGMQFGAATLCSNISSMPEIIGSAGILLSPYDADAWAHAMLQLNKTPETRKQLSRKAIQQARRFSWQESAACLLELYLNAVDTPKRRAL